jgi:hypothetical protein
MIDGAATPSKFQQRGFMGVAHARTFKELLGCPNEAVGRFLVRMRLAVVAESQSCSILYRPVHRFWHSVLVPFSSLTPTSCSDACMTPSTVTVVKAPPCFLNPQIIFRGAAGERNWTWHQTMGHPGT